jgi:hypothetical protein
VKRVENSTNFVWNDGTPFTDENWDVNRPDDDEEKICVIIQWISAEQMENSESLRIGSCKHVLCEFEILCLVSEIANMDIPSVAKFIFD